MSKLINCSIITIGDELLIGQTIDTNSAWIAQQLNEIGIWVKRRLAIGDVREDILAAFQQESNYADLIIITGGLGPTADDITKPVLCEYFGSSLVQNQKILDHVTEIFKVRNRPMLEVNLLQAMVPSNCSVLFNEVGTAAGMWFEKDGKVYISLPGVPFEMQHIISTKALPKLKSYFTTPRILHRTIVTSGEGESFIANRLIEFESKLPDYIKLAYLPKLGIVKLRLTALDILDSEIDFYFDELKNQIANIIVSDKDIEIEEAIYNLLLEKNETLSIAESCTGGGLSARITSIKGSSNIFKGGLIPYSIESKINVLGVKKETIDQHTVISSETVEEMAELCRLKLKSTYALSVSGHLEKQENETFVWIGLSKQGKTLSKKVNVFYDREKNGIMITNTALNLLRLFILDRI
jgi:nicotinamide-nucleotide amidase